MVLTDSTRENAQARNLRRKRALRALHVIFEPSEWLGNRERLGNGVYKIYRMKISEV
jgi:hypothetical protein